ncbi:CMP-N-acetylneuraminate-poly-alpha-2,8-sialyltransferase-like isoform X2 [Lytechinus pictus]|uniref:CMP-N-acetylneuraminate-poly-alpha-2, 8-sialyltransferase-like isoform X2 n=1 Tax=Lytechinus pictus TaxID=7653 RepID=UPI0030B9E35E
MVLNRSKALWCLLLTTCVSLSWLLWYKAGVWTSSVNNTHMFKFSPLTVKSEDKYITHYIEDIRNYTNSNVHSVENDAFIFDYKEKNINATVALEIRNKVQKIMKPWRTIQVYRPNVNPMDMHWVTNLQQLRKSNQTDWIEHRVKTCAVVGNSGILLGSNCGPTIDSMDIIIRMNLAEFGFGFSSDVGSRVTYMTINREQLRLVLACFLNMTKADVEELRTNTTTPVLSAECDNFIRRFRMIQEDVLWLFKGRLPGLQEIMETKTSDYGPCDVHRCYSTV